MKKTSKLSAAEEAAQAIAAFSKTGGVKCSLCAILEADVHAKTVVDQIREQNGSYTAISGYLSSRKHKASSGVVRNHFAAGHAK